MRPRAYIMILPDWSYEGFVTFVVQKRLQGPLVDPRYFQLRGVQNPPAPHGSDPSGAEITKFTDKSLATYGHSPAELDAHTETSLLTVLGWPNDRHLRRGHLRVQPRQLPAR